MVNDVRLTFTFRGRRVRDRHLRAGPGAPCRWLALADVLVGPVDGDRHGDDCGEREAVATAAALARRCPGALVVAVHRGAACWLRLGAGPERSLRLGVRQAAGAPWEVWASLAHAWLVSGLPVAELGSVSVRRLRAQDAGPLYGPAPGSSPPPSCPPGPSSAASRVCSSAASAERFTAE